MFSFLFLVLCCPELNFLSFFFVIKQRKKKNKNETKYFAAAADGYNIFKSAGDSFLYIYYIEDIDRWALHFVAFVFFLFSYLIWGLWGPRTVGARNPLGPLIGWRLTPPLSSFPRLAHSASGEMSAMRAR